MVRNIAAWMALLGASALLPEQASATIIFTDNFSKDTVGSHLGLDKWTVAGSAVNILNDPASGVTCNSAPNCLELASGQVQSLGIYTEANNNYKLGFYLSGSQKTLDLDGGQVSVSVMNYLSKEILATGTIHLASATPWQLFTMSFRQNTWDTLSIIFNGSPGADGLGVLLDDVNLEVLSPDDTGPWFGQWGVAGNIGSGTDITDNGGGGIADTPEPGTWLMIGSALVLFSRRALRAQG